MAPLGAYPSVEMGALAPVPSGAPLHVFGLLGAGFLDLSIDQGMAASPLISFVALALGGLWSRRLGPHREVWSWDIVEITALDLLVSEVIAEHLWQRAPLPVGVAWGGGEVRLFRAGLAASHHHLSMAGSWAYSYGPWSLGLGAAAPSLSLSVLYAPGSSPTTRPARVKVKRGPTPGYGAPVTLGEASLAAWGLALLAPSSGAVSAWGLWGAPIYLWLGAIPPFVYLGLLSRKPARPLWVHYPLVPLAHVFGTPLPWAPNLLLSRFG